MLKTILNQSAENFPSSTDGANNAEVGSGISSTTRSDENLPSNMAKDAEVGGNGDGSDDETVERSPLSKKLNGSIGYLTSLRSNANSASFAKR